MVQLATYVSAEVADRVKAIAEREDRPISYVVRRAVVEEINKQADAA